MTKAHGAVYSHWLLSTRASSCFVLTCPKILFKNRSDLSASYRLTNQSAIAVHRPISSLSSTPTYDAAFEEMVLGNERVETVYVAV
jgi:hypothetical protein